MGDTRRRQENRELHCARTDEFAAGLPVYFPEGKAQNVTQGGLGKQACIAAHSYAI